MGKRIAGHQNCLICHPDLDKNFVKLGYAKGPMRYKASDRRLLQEPLRALIELAKLETWLSDNEPFRMPSRDE